MKKLIIAASLVALTVLGGCASTQGFGARFERNLQLDVTGGQVGTTGRYDAAGQNLQIQGGKAVLQKINLANPGPHDLAIFGEEASLGQRQWPNYYTASGWALFMRLSKVLGGLLRAKEGTQIPGINGARIKYCMISSLVHVTCFYDGGAVGGPILYAGGHIAFKAEQFHSVVGIIPLY